ncbi:MAG: hypothetical protein NTX02_03400, partial [Planctomycetia bacterium]|nr:hypothetical protein [Planctomycetia bacterium]
SQYPQSRCRHDPEKRLVVVGESLPRLPGFVEMHAIDDKKSLLRQKRNGHKFSGNSSIIDRATHR